MLSRMDLWLACGLGVLAIIMYLLPNKTPLIIVIFLVIAFGLSFYIVWTFPWLKESLGRRLAGLLFIAACLCMFGDYVWPPVAKVNQPQPKQVAKQPTAQEISIFEISPPSYGQAKIVAIVPDDFKGGHIWPPDKNIPNTTLFFKTIYVLEVKNQTQENKTIRGLHLQFVDRNGKFVNLPIYEQQGTTIDLDPGISVSFEIAYQYTLESERPPTEPIPVSIPVAIFNGIYNPLHDPKNKHGFLDICQVDRGKFLLGININQLPALPQKLVQIVLPKKLQLTAIDTPSQSIVLRVYPDSQRGFTIKISEEAIND